MKLLHIDRRDEAMSPWEFCKYVESLKEPLKDGDNRFITEELFRTWVSIIYRIPVYINFAGNYKSEDAKLCGDYNKVHAIFKIYGRDENFDLWVDPLMFDIFLERPDAKHFRIRDINDTFKLVEMLEEIKNSNLFAPEDFKVVDNNLKRLNSVLQQFTIKTSFLTSYDGDNEKVADILERYYDIGK